MTPAIPNPHVFHQYQSLCSVVSLSCTFLVIIHTLSTPWCLIPLRCSLSVLRGGSCQETDPHLRQETPSNREDHLMNPPARRSGEKFKSISLLSFCHPLPNQICLSTALQRYQSFSKQHINIFTRRGLVNRGLCFHYCLGQ